MPKTYVTLVCSRLNKHKNMFFSICKGYLKTPNLYYLLFAQRHKENTSVFAFTVGNHIPFMAFPHHTGL